MNGGLDQQVQQKVDAYRGNPQALMQRYQQNQQLLDLLALQKLKSEKEAAARQMQLQMQQTPQTVAQQREQEVLGLTKQELAQQTQGIMQQRQAQQQKNLQQVAQGGLGALAPQRAPTPAPQGQPMPRMAGGGIVAFNQGGLSSMGGLYGVTQEEIDAYRAARRGQGSRATRALSDEEIARRIAGIREGGGTVPMTPGEARRAARTGVQPDISDIGRPAGVPEDYEPGTIAQFGPEGARPRPLPPEVMARRPVEAPAALGGMSTMGQGPMSTTGAMQSQPGGLAGLLPQRAEPQMSVPEGGIPTVTPPATETAPVPEAATSGGTAGGGGLPGLGLGGPEAAMRRGFATADEYLGRGEKAARYAEMEAELARLDEGVAERARDPNRRLTEFLLGGGGRSSAAGALGAAGRALLAYDDRIDRQERERLISRISLSERGMTVDSELGRAGLELGRVMFSEAAQNQRAAMQAANTLRVEELRQMREDARQQANELRLDRAYDLDRLKYELDVAQEDRAARGESYAAAANIVNNVSVARKKAIDSLLSKDQNYLMARMRESQAESPEERQQAEAAVDAIINMAVLRANMMLDAADEDGGGLSMLAMEQRALELMYNRYFSDAGISPEDVTGTSYTE